MVIQVGEFELNTQTTFSEALFNYVPGDEIDVVIQRGEEQITVTVTLGDRSEALS